MSHLLLLLLLPMACRFERWRREIMPDLNAQLDVWTHEVMDLVDAAEAALSRQVQVTMMPQLGAFACFDWLPLPWLVAAPIAFGHT